MKNKIKPELMMYIFASIFLLSCGPKNCVCRCYNAGLKNEQNYNQGDISLSDAQAKCIALKAQYSWDTCLALQITP
jgi:hypothetical protein